MEENQEDEMEDFYLSDTRNEIDQINLKNLKVSPVYGI